MYGVFLGGSPLDNNYRPTGTRHYRFTSQCCGAKVINLIEKALLSAINSKESEKFNGNLEKSESFAANEMDKEMFTKQLQKKVTLHGQQTFYAIMYQNQVLSLFEHYHKFTVEDVIAHHEFQSEEPDPEFNPTTNQETAASIQLRFESYDNYEFDDFGLSRLVV